MQLIDTRNPNERKKIILAGVLGLVAIVFLWWTFFGFGSSSNNVTPRPANQPPRSGISNAPNPRTGQPVPDEVAGLDQLVPINPNITPVSAPAASRNIFVYYEPKPPPVVEAVIPTPTPTPVPPVLLAGVNPSTVFARTSDFTLEVSGDKFAPGMRIVVDNTELATKYQNAQQLSAVVPAAMIASPGTRQIMVRSTDGKFYSNTSTITVNAPPTPNYSYIGIIGTPRFIDTAILQDKTNKELLNVQRGDLVGGRFRVTSISEKEVVFVDNSLKVKHTLAMTAQGDRGGPMQRPTPRVDSEDDEP